MSELLENKVNALKVSLKNTSGVHVSSRKPMKKCAMKMKQRKNDVCVKILLMEGGTYRIGVEKSCHGYQRTSSQ